MKSLQRLQNWMMKSWFRVMMRWTVSLLQM